MGVPAFFRWLSEKYPRCLLPVLETQNGEAQTEAPTSNAECDNLYIDMNGVIHPCAHPEDRDAPATEEQMFEDVLLYVDRLVAVARPTTLVYLAIDGVAPRAKLNQQRARRWKTAKEAQEKRESEREMRAALVGANDPEDDDEKESSAEFDSNVITPGTAFMTRLARRIRAGVQERQRLGKKFWKDVVVIVDDASNAGEGEHKIMRFVRSLRSLKNYDVNTSHVLHGLDADLIMLALATHEVDFSILREEVLFGRQAKQTEEANKVARENHAKLVAEREGSKHWVFTKPLQILKVSILREYLKIEFAELQRQMAQQQSSWYDFERAVDDFVFLCFFCGNDFIPHLPSLDIREGALDLLLNVYKTALPHMSGHITADGGRIELRRLGELLTRVGRVEDEIFKRRKQAQDQDRDRRKRQRARSEPPPPPATPGLMPLGRSTSSHALLLEASPYSPGALRDAPAPVVDSALKEVLSRKEKRKLDEVAANFTDEIRLGDEGWKDRYYKGEFKQRDIRAGGGMDALMQEYVKGLDWILRYYYAGCVSWGWYFPFHYAPFASDLASYVNRLVDEQDREAPVRKKRKVFPSSVLLPKKTSSKKTSDQFGDEVEENEDDSNQRKDKVMYLHEVVSQDLVLGKPLTPLEQLMAVLPAASAHAIPGPCRELMLNKQMSPVADFYPDDVDVDPNGKAMPWLHVVLLPFVDEERLITSVADAVGRATDPKDRQMVFDATMKRDAVVYARFGNDLADTISQSKTSESVVAGILGPPPSDVACEDLACASLKPETVPRLHESKILPGAVTPPDILTGDDRRPRGPPRLGARSNVAELGLSSAGMNVDGQRSWGSMEPRL